VAHPLSVIDEAAKKNTTLICCLAQNRQPAASPIYISVGSLLPVLERLEPVIKKPLLD
jgi:hypothetical protein